MKDISIIVLAGGTGAGKSTVSFGLLDRNPDKISLVHLDDYHRKKEDVPTLAGMTNWDCPEAIDFDLLAEDLKKLKAGEDVVVMTKNDRDNPDYGIKGRIPIVVSSKPIIILEGYLALWAENIRELLDFGVFLDLSHEERMRRRTKFLNKEYEEKVLLPMNRRYVESTKEFADLVIDVSLFTKEEIIKKTEEVLSGYLANK